MNAFGLALSTLLALTTWTATTGTRGVTLAHGTPETDERDFRADCEPGSGRIVVSLTKTVPGLSTGAPLEVRIGTGKQIVRYMAVGRMDTGTATVMPVFLIAPDDRLLAWMARGATVRFRAGGGMDYHITGSGSAAAITTFIAACKRS